jgi:antitoxin ParD1/3/4
MRTTQQMSITLPNEMAEIVRAKVLTGEYASESEVIRDGLRAMVARDRALEHWLKTEVAASYDEMKANPSRGISVEQMRAKLAAKNTK